MIHRAKLGTKQFVTRPRSPFLPLALRCFCCPLRRYASFCCRNEAGEAVQAVAGTGLPTVAEVKTTTKFTLRERQQAADERQVKW